MTPPTPPVPADFKLIVFGWITTILGLPKDGNPDQYNELTDRLVEVFESTMLSVIGRYEHVDGIHEDFGHEYHRPRDILRTEQRTRLNEVLGKQSEEEK